MGTIYVEPGSKAVTAWVPSSTGGSSVTRSGGSYIYGATYVRQATGQTIRYEFLGDPRTYTYVGYFNIRLPSTTTLVYRSK